MGKLIDPPQGARRHFFSSKAQIKQLAPLKHIAIVMDGNRRWAKQRGRLATAGHWKGAEVVQEIVQIATEINLETLTLYAFSTENWKRSSIEVEAIMRILKAFLNKMAPTMIEGGVRFDTIGDLCALPHSLQELIEGVKESTSNGTKLNLVLALNYGSRDEVKRAVVKAYREIEERGGEIDSLTEDMISRHLDTAPYGDPDLIIRTGGMNRQSNFLLWQSSYAEFAPTPILWPDFTREDFITLVRDYQCRERRHGA